MHNQRIERLWRDFHRCATQLFIYYLEYHGYLNPIDKKFNNALHYVFIVIINKAATQAWNNYGLRTENARSPNQLFTSGMLRLLNSDNGNPGSNHGEDKEGLVTISEESGVEIPHSSTEFSDAQLQQLQANVNP